MIDTISVDLRFDPRENVRSLRRVPFGARVRAADLVVSVFVPGIGGCPSGQRADRKCPLLAYAFGSFGDPGSARVLTRNFGGIPKRPTGADCKSAGLRLRWFESTSLHQFYELQDSFAEVDENHRFDKIVRNNFERDAQAPRPEGRRAGCPE